MVSVSPALPKKERRYRKKRSRDYQEEIPPEIPAKGKVGGDDSETQKKSDYNSCNLFLHFTPTAAAKYKHQSKLRFTLGSFCTAWLTKHEYMLALEVNIHPFNI